MRESRRLAVPVLPEKGPASNGDEMTSIAHVADPASPVPAPDGTAEKASVKGSMLMDAVAITFAGVLGLAIRLYESWQHAMPFGFAGLYTLMAETISHAHYSLPTRIPFYGPGGIPFAYPPLSLYLMAAIHDVAHIPYLTYLRFAPVALSALYVYPLYSLYKRVTSRGTAFIATCLAMTAPDIAVYHEFADGAVRATAFVFTCAGLWSSTVALKSGNRRFLAPAALCFALTILSHLSNAVFFALTLVVIASTSGRRAGVWLQAALIGVGGVLVSAPWWLAVVQIHGFSPFWHALYTRGGMTGQDPRPYGLVAVLDKFLPVAQVWYPEYALAFVGCLVCLRRKQWFIPLWLAVTGLFAPDYQRFVPMVAAPAAGLAVLAAWRATQTVRRPRVRAAVRVLAGAGGALAGAVLLTGYFFWSINVRPLLREADLHAGEWMQNHTRPSATYILAGSDRQLAEWFPYLTRRTPVTAEWGAEWTGRVGVQHVRFTSEALCVARQSLGCLDALVPALGTDYLVLPRGDLSTRLFRQLASSSAWHLRYIYGADSIWQRDSQPQ